MRITLIVACARNGVIGRGNAIPWRLPEDQARLKRITMGHPIVMGRKTWDSLGRPLPGRRNIVVTRQPAWHAAGAEAVPSIEAALALCAGVSDVYVIGGAQVYRDALPLADMLDVTEVALDVDGDTFFPPIDGRDWVEVAREAHVDGGPDRPAFAFVQYARRSDPS